MAALIELLLAGYNCWNFIPLLHIFGCHSNPIVLSLQNDGWESALWSLDLMPSQQYKVRKNNSKNKIQEASSHTRGHYGDSDGIGRKRPWQPQMIICRMLANDRNGLWRPLLHKSPHSEGNGATYTAHALCHQCLWCEGVMLWEHSIAPDPMCSHGPLPPPPDMLQQCTAASTTQMVPPLC